jgi:BMFP domain-containing protein YqiC
MDMNDKLSKLPFKMVVLGIITIITIACNQKKQQAAPNIMPVQYESQSEMIRKHNERVRDSLNKDTTAIGNIHLNITREEFESQRRIFMEETPELGGLKIKSVNGLFYNDRLAAVQIISQQQNAHKKGMAFNEGWYYLYYQKYGSSYNHSSSRFTYERGRKGIIVTDVCASDKPFSSFEEFMENPLSTCYSDQSLFNARGQMDKFEAITSVSDVLRYLPKSRQNYYNQMINNDVGRRSNSTDIFTRGSYVIYEQVYEKARHEANAIIERRNEINSKKHKNDPSWSVVIIAFLPSCDNYRREISREAEKIKEEKKKELDKI